MDRLQHTMAAAVALLRTTLRRQFQEDPELAYEAAFRAAMRYVDHQDVTAMRERAKWLHTGD